MGKLKTFDDVPCMTIDRDGNKEKTYFGQFTSRKKVDKEIREVKRITVENKAEAEFVINVRINYTALGRLPPSGNKLRFLRKGI